MVWALETSQGHEQDKIAALVIPYTRGKCLDLGCGPRAVWPRCVGMDREPPPGYPRPQIAGDIADLSMFADGSYDGVFSSHAVEDFPEARVPAVLREWARVLKTGGYLTLYVPSANLYPKVGEEGANPAHKWNIYPGDIERHLRAATDCGWTQIECEERSQGNEYSLFLVFRKRDDGEWVEDFWQRNPEGRKRALVIRYGAIGDQIVAASILPGLRNQGYHVTYNTTPDAQHILKHDPHIDEWLIQDKDQVPNEQLGPYWEALRERYDHVINLCESIEGPLLALPGRLNHFYTPETRRRIAGTVNYLERTHDIAAVPHKFAAFFHMSDAEQQWGRDWRGGLTGPVVLWAINGSSPHKVWPYTQIVTAWLAQKTPAHVFLCADGGIGKQLQDTILKALEGSDLDFSRIHPMAGVWDIRECLTAAHFADVVVGPETGTLNAVCMAPVKKVIYLSHSSHENLTKHWRNTTVLEPDPATAPCYPCHQLHYDWSHCPQSDKTNAALCASSIGPERVFEAIALALGARKAA